MPKRKTPGLSKSKGMQSGFVLFPDGKYVVEFVSYKEKESAKGTGTTHQFNLRCLDVLGDDPEEARVDMVEKMYFHRMFEFYEDHESFEEHGHIFTDHLKSMLDATGVNVTKSDTWDPQEFIGKTAIITVGTKDGQDAEGNPRPENVVRKWEADSEEAE